MKIIKSLVIIVMMLVLAGCSTTVEKPFLAYLVTGNGIANDSGLKQGDLFKAARLDFEASSEITMIVIYKL